MRRLRVLFPHADRRGALRAINVNNEALVFSIPSCGSCNTVRSRELIVASMLLPHSTLLDERIRTAEQQPDELFLFESPMP